MIAEPSGETGARARTRSAILNAAASVLARDRTATLPDIAAAAGVGRTTVHRYYADRETLLRATVRNSVAVLQHAVVEAEVDVGPPQEALRRAVTAMVAAGDHLLFLYGEPGVRATEGDADVPAPDPVLDLIERGQVAGVFDASVSALWIEHTLWSLVFRGCLDADRGDLPRHSVVATVVRTLENGIRVPRDGQPTDGTASSRYQRQ